MLLERETLAPGDFPALHPDGGAEDDEEGAAPSAGRAAGGAPATPKKAIAR